MRPIDLTHPWGLHTPAWPGGEAPRIRYMQRLSSHRVVSQWIETGLHVGTHIDAPMHFAPGGGDMASLPLTQLFREGVIVDISDVVGEWDIIRPEHITSKAEVRKGDILIYHTGWHHYYVGEREQDEERYMCRHPGGGAELARWIVEMELAWTGVDTGAADHPMNTPIRVRRPDLARECEERRGRPLDADFPPEHFQVMHRVPFARNIVHVENVGGDLDQVLGRRCRIGAFPWRFVGGEASICRVVAFVD